MPAQKTFHFTVNAEKAANGDPQVTISTGETDRHRDRVLPAGINLDNYRKNPVVLFCHSYHELPVGTATSIEQTETGLRATWAWFKNDPFAERVKNAWDQGILRAASIGFIPTKVVHDEDRRGFDILESELLEFSLVAVPANAEAVRTMKAIGLPLAPTDEAVLALDERVTALEATKAALADVISEPADDSDEFFTLDADPTDPDLTDDEIAATVREALASVAKDAADQACLRLSGRVD